METMEKIKSTAGDIGDKIRPQLVAAREKLTTANDTVLELIKAHPGKFLLGALALGYLAGRIARRGGLGDNGVS